MIEKAQLPAGLTYAADRVAASIAHAFLRYRASTSLTRLSLAITEGQQG